MSRKPSASVRLDLLRRALAATENHLAIRHLKGAGTVLLKQTNDEELRGRIASFISLCAAKAFRLRPPTPPKPKRAPVPLGGTMPQIKMIIGPWHVDELGILSREIYSADAVTVPLS